MPQTPYIVGGTVYQNGGSTPSSGTTVTLVQESTSNTLSTTTNSNGQYIFDIANFSTAYADDDFYQIIVSGSTSTDQDLRLKIIARDTFQVSLIKVEYEVI